MRLILASTSPRRREILGLLKVPFDVVSPTFDEVVSAGVPIEEEVLEFAAGKAQSVAHAYPGAVVIGSDTMIGLDGHKIGKPADEDDARRILGLLSGRRHVIYTSVVILDGAGGSGLRIVETVDVEMIDMTPERIDAYLAAGESLDKAGAYSIQGAGRALIRSMRGDYLAAVGLPLRPVAEYLAGVRLPVDIRELYQAQEFYNWRSF